MKRGTLVRLAFSVWAFSVGALVGCGRYRAPLPPEMFAPKAVEALSVTATEEGVVLAWSAPDEDRRGKELGSIDGYAIQRKIIVERGDETNAKVHFEIVGFVDDRHVAIREELRAAARKEGKIGRSIESPVQYTAFSFRDSTAKRSMTYLYQIVPQNQGGTEGVVNQAARVAFKGAASDIAMISSQEVQEDDTLLDDAGALS